jgi:serine/threonine protein kinase
VNPPLVEILTTCPQCSHEFRVPGALVGRRLPCPYCRRLIDVAATAPPEDKLVGKVLGGCRLVRRLGAGALGVVYEADQQSMSRRVAMKLLSSKAAADPNVVARFQREAKICAQIKHPHVVGVYDCGFDRGVHFLIMEYVDGTTLAGLVDERGTLPWREAAKHIRQVAQALDHVASLNIVHRDIKPANILVSAAGEAKLADLGLAKQIEGEGGGDGMGLTMMGVAMGSPAYMAPEQVRNTRDAGKAADIYSLGATFYHLLTGVPPFDGRSGHEVLTKVLRDQPRPLTELAPATPPGIARLVHKMLAKKVADRPQDAAGLIAEIDAALAAPAVAPPTRAVGGAAPGGFDSSIILLGAGVGALVVVIACTLWVMLR